MSGKRTPASPGTNLAFWFLKQNHDTVKSLITCIYPIPRSFDKKNPSTYKPIPHRCQANRPPRGLARELRPGSRGWICEYYGTPALKHFKFKTCQNGNDPCRRKRLETMERSATVEKLIDLIGRGRCSIATAAGVSHSMVEDGVCHQAIQTFSSLGASGAFPGNYERDLRTWLKNLFNFSLETYSIPMRLQAHWIFISSNLFCLTILGITLQEVYSNSGA